MTEAEPGRTSNRRLWNTTEMSAILLTSGTDRKPGTLRLAAPAVVETERCCELVARLPRTESRIRILRISTPKRRDHLVTVH